MDSEVSQIILISLRLSEFYVVVGVNTIIQAQNRCNS